MQGPGQACEQDAVGLPGQLLSKKNMSRLPPLQVGVGFLGCRWNEHLRRPHGRVRQGRKLYLRGITP